MVYGNRMFIFIIFKYKKAGKYDLKNIYKHQYKIYWRKINNITMSISTCLFPSKLAEFNASDRRGQKCVTLFPVVIIIAITTLISL